MRLGLSSGVYTRTLTTTARAAPRCAWASPAASTRASTFTSPPNPVSYWAVGDTTHRVHASGQDDLRKRRSGRSSHRAVEELVYEALNKSPQGR